MEVKCALAVAANMMLGHIQLPDEDIQFTLEQTVASEFDAHRVQLIKDKPRCEFHKLNAMCKDLSSCT